MYIPFQIPILLVERINLCKPCTMHNFFAFMHIVLERAICRCCMKYVFLKRLFTIFIFSPNDSPTKTMKNAFLFHLRSSHSQGIQFFVIFPFLSTLLRFKRANESRIIYDFLNWLAWISRYNFWNNWKTALYYIIKLGQVIYH